MVLLVAQNHSKVEWCIAHYLDPKAASDWYDLQVVSLSTVVRIFKYGST